MDVPDIKTFPVIPLLLEGSVVGFLLSDGFFMAFVVLKTVFMLWSLNGQRLFCPLY
jgi:hypothetical protein